MGLPLHVTAVSTGGHKSYHSRSETISVMEDLSLDDLPEDEAYDLVAEQLRRESLRLLLNDRKE